MISDIKFENQKKSVFILDVPFHTFMYKLIYENLPFLMFFNRDWKKFFTKDYSEFLNFCNQKKVLFYWDQQDDFLMQLDIINKTNLFTRKNNLDIKNYLKKTN